MSEAVAARARCTRYDDAVNSGLPATSSAVPLALSATSEDVAEILADSRAGCVAPLGAVVILSVGMAGAFGAWVALSPTSAQIYIGSVIAAALGWALAPSAIQRRRATLALRAYGLSAAQIGDIRAVAQPIVRARGGMDRESTKREILAALRGMPLFAPRGP